MFTDFRERRRGRGQGEEREREGRRERETEVSITSLTQPETVDPGRCPNWEWNQ